MKTLSNRLLTPEAIEAYIRHTVDSVPMREIARDKGREPSTVMRQVRRVEDFRDNPDWGFILDKLAEAWDREVTLDRAQVFKALEVTLDEATAEMQKLGPILSEEGALVGITEGCMAGIFVDNEVMRRTDRRIALAWIATGWLMLTNSSPRVRRYQVTDRAATEVSEDESPPLVPTPKAVKTDTPKYTRKAWGDEPIEKLRLMKRRGLANVTGVEIQTAIELRELMHLAKHEGQGSASLIQVVAIQKALGPEMFDLLHDFLHVGTGLEQLEKNYSWPARSAKVVLVVALQQVQHFDLLTQKEVAIAS